MHVYRGINQCYTFLVLISVLQGALKSTMMPYQHTYAVVCKSMYDLKDANGYKLKPETGCPLVTVKHSKYFHYYVTILALTSARFLRLTKPTRTFSPHLPLGKCLF